jgi:hypothetical protein
VLRSREPGTVLNATLELGNGDPLVGVGLEDHAEDVVELVRQR